MLAAIAVMSLVSHLPRILPLVAVQKRIKSPFVQSFLLYMPYGVLAAMIFPAVLDSTGGIVSALCGFAVALVMSWRRMGLLPVSLGAVGTVFVVEQLLVFFG